MKTREIAHELAEKGYQVRPIPAKQKHPKGYSGWQHAGNDRWLKSWSDPGIGITLGGLAIIDFDIDNPELESLVDDWVRLVDPKNEIPLRFRASSTTRKALLVRAPELDGTDVFIRRTGRYPSGMVEILGGSSRICFALGVHTDGKGVEAALEWDPDLYETSKLPEMSIEMLEELQKTFDDDLATRETQLEPAATQNGFQKHDDLHWETKLSDERGRVSTVRDLWDPKEAVGGLSMTEWRPDSDSCAGELKMSTERPTLMLTDFAHNVIHFMPEVEFEEGEEPDYEALEGARGLLQPTEATEQALEKSDEATHRVFATEQWRKQFVWVGGEERFYSLKDPDMAPKSRLAMRQALGSKSADFDDVFRNWELVADQLVWDPSEVPASLVTRPSGRVDLNTYTEPTFPAGGDTAEFFRFLETFIPDPYERDILLDWMALKVQRPGDRYFAVVLLGPEGSGKGLFSSIFSGLFQPSHVTRTSLSFLLQGTYDDPLHQSLICTVDEAEGSSTHHRDREANYRTLREKVDPSAREMKLNIKGARTQRQKVYTTFLFCTNDTDALPLEGDQRRFCVLQTGAEMSPPDANALVEWMRSEANLGALRTYLAARQPTVTPHQAPMTAAKEQMGIANRTEIDEVVDAFIDLVLEVSAGWYVVAQAKQFAVQAGFHDERRLDVIKAKLRKRSTAPFGTKKNKVKFSGNYPEPMKCARGGSEGEQHEGARHHVVALQSHLDAPCHQEHEK